MKSTFYSNILRLPRSIWISGAHQITMDTNYNHYHCYAFCQQLLRINKQQITSMPYLNLPIHLHRNISGNLKKHICIELNPTKTSSNHTSLCVEQVSPFVLRMTLKVQLFLTLNNFIYIHISDITGADKQTSLYFSFCMKNSNNETNSRVWRWSDRMRRVSKAERQLRKSARHPTEKENNAFPQLRWPSKPWNSGAEKLIRTERFL